MNALRIIGFLGVAAALISALIYRLLAFQHREPGNSFIRAMLEGGGFTEVGARYLRLQYIAMAVAFALVLLLVAIWPRP